MENMPREYQVGCSFSAVITVALSNGVIVVPPIPDDEDLANVMMSWYYAGYYSGIYAAKVCVLKSST